MLLDSEGYKNIPFTQDHSHREEITKSDIEKSSVELTDSDNFQLLYSVTHLNCFDDLLDATGLLGEEYKPIMKAVWYNLLSVLIAKKELSVGGINVDGRIHVLIFLPSGSGKTEIKNINKLILGELGKESVEPTSYHPEQFMGKVVVEKHGKGEKKYKKIRGYLSSDYLIVDEGKDLLTSNESTYAESRKYLRLGMDQLPHNMVTKKSVDIERKHALTYQPHCCICLFCQPFHMGEELVLDGDFRRFIISYIPLSLKDKTELYRNRIMKERDYINSVNNFVKFLESLEVPEEFKLSDEAKNTLVELSILLINKGETYSTKVKNFTKIAGFSIQNILLKFSAIQALQNNTGTIEPEHVELAFVDYAEILEQTFSYVNNKIMGNMDYGENLQGAIKKDQELLKWLIEEGATSQEKSKISIKEYQEKIMKKYKVKKRQARRHQAKHVENGWIEIKKGQHDSKVWLKIKPKDQTIDEVSKDRVDKQFIEKYLEIIKRHNMHTNIN